MGQKCTKWYFMYQCWQKDENQKQTLLWGELFINETVYRIFEFLTQFDDFINPKVPWKKAQTRISCTNGNRRWEWKVWETLSWGIYLWNHFFEILKFQSHALMSWSQSWVKKTQICISCTTSGKNLKIKNYFIGRSYCRKKILWGKSGNFRNFFFRNNIIFHNLQLFLLQQYNFSQFASFFLQLIL